MDEKIGLTEFSNSTLVFGDKCRIGSEGPQCHTRLERWDARSLKLAAVESWCRIRTTGYQEEQQMMQALRELDMTGWVSLILLIAVLIVLGLMALVPVVRRHAPESDTGD